MHRLIDEKDLKFRTAERNENDNDPTFRTTKGANRNTIHQTMCGLGRTNNDLIPEREINMQHNSPWTSDEHSRPLHSNKQF